MRQEKLFSFIGLFLLVYWLLHSIINLYYESYSGLFWVCTLLLFFSAVGFLYGSNRILTAALLVSLLFQSTWIVDFLHYLVTGSFLFIHVADYILVSPWPIRISTFHHLFLPFLLLFGVWRLGVAKDGWRYACAFLAVAFSAGALFGPAKNVNAVYAQEFFRTGLPQPLQSMILMVGILALLIALNVLLGGAFRKGVNSLEKAPTAASTCQVSFFLIVLGRCRCCSAPAASLAAEAPSYLKGLL